MIVHRYYAGFKYRQDFFLFQPDQAAPSDWHWILKAGHKDTMTGSIDGPGNGVWNEHHIDNLMDALPFSFQPVMRSLPLPIITSDLIGLVNLCLQYGEPFNVPDETDS